MVKADDVRRKYYRRTNETKSKVPWGQRKLMIIEIEFLQNIGIKSSAKSKSGLCGGCPGKHIQYFGRIVSGCRILSLGSQSFHIQDYAACIFQEYFTEETAHSGPIEMMSFYFNIRTADYKTMECHKNEQQILADLELQKRCHLVMNPCESLLKFRLPYSDLGSQPHSIPEGGALFHNLGHHKLRQRLV